LVQDASIVGFQRTEGRWSEKQVLDEFELFGRAFNDAEVRELYIKGKPD